jgi:hypothetical protein
MCHQGIAVATKRTFQCVLCVQDQGWLYGMSVPQRVASPRSPAFRDGKCVFPPKAGCILKNKGEEVHVTSAAERYVRSIPEYHIRSITGSEYSMTLEELQELPEARECWDANYPEADEPQSADVETKLCLRRLLGDNSVSEWGLAQSYWGHDESLIPAEESDVISTAVYEL